MVRKTLLVLFIILGGYTLTIRSVTYMVPLFVFILFLFFASHVALAGRINTVCLSEVKFNAIIQIYVQVCFIALVIVFYGLFTSAIYQWNLKEGLSLAFRMIPIAFFPVYAYLFPSKRDWMKCLIFFVIIGTISAILDLRSGSSAADELIRMASAEFTSIDYFYALLASICLLLILPMNKYITPFLLVCTPILIWRTIRAVSRAEMAMAVLCCVYCIVVRVYCENKRLRLLLNKKLFFVIIGFSYFTYKMFEGFELEKAFDFYTKFLMRRSEHTGSSFMYRWSELSNAFSYGGIFGQGWGALADFSEARLYTSSALGFGTKTYVHNVVGFLVWKLGYFVGGALIVMFLYHLVAQFLKNIRMGDRLGFIMSGLLIFWSLHSMVNMYFAKPEMNLWVSTWLGYFFWREFNSAIPGESSKRLL